MASKRAFRIGRSRTGLGLFATTPFKKGAFIVEHKGRKLTTEQADKLEARGNRYLLEINSRWTIDGTSRKNLGRYANHSCRPNAEAHTIGHKVIIRAIKNIRAGAEITYNYGRDYLTNVITRRGCKCGQAPEETSGCAREDTRQKPKSPAKPFNKDFLLALAADFKCHGAQAIEKVRKTQPAAYMKICALLVFDASVRRSRA
jgi:uncharacterized protein